MISGPGTGVSSRRAWPKPQPLLGESRATDLAINVILPWFSTRARAGKNQHLTAIGRGALSGLAAGAGQQPLAPGAAALAGTAHAGVRQISRAPARPAANRTRLLRSFQRGLRGLFVPGYGAPIMRDPFMIQGEFVGAWERHPRAAISAMFSSGLTRLAVGSTSVMALVIC